MRSERGAPPAEALRMTEWASPMSEEGPSDREERKAVNIGSFVLLEDGSSFRVTLLDVSMHGCRIETPIYLLPGLKLKVSVGKLGALPGEVRWCNNDRAGIRFKLEEAEPEKNEARREETRSAINATAMLRRLGRQAYSARVFDLSRTGCKVEFIERPQAGEQVWIKFEGLDSIEARVRWVDGFYGGLEFVPAIHPAVFERLLARLAG